MEYNVNLNAFKIKITGDGVEHQFGTDAWNLTFGLSIDKGFSLNGTASGLELNTAFRPGGGSIIGGLIFGGVLAIDPAAAPIVATKLIPLFQ